MTRASDFWDAVGAAHELGRVGAGSVVAVIDDCFDTSFDALGEQDLRWPNDPATSTAHGTVVALLILEVAPAARLLLYPASRDGRLQKDLVLRAIGDAVSKGASTINLSMGQAQPFREVFRAREFFDPADFWSDMTDDDVPYWVSDRLASRPKSAWLDVPADDLGVAAEAATRHGVRVIAAAGNYNGFAFSPALASDVISVGFHRESRVASAGMELASSRSPSYLQSELVDFGIIQPPEVLGSSFATPLLAGFSCLMLQRDDLVGFRDVGLRAGLAGQLMTLASEVAPDRRRLATIDKLFGAAVSAMPHRHPPGTAGGQCPDCAWFAFAAYNDYGLFKLNVGDTASAEALLRTARAIAPWNPYSAANLGVVYGRIANDMSREDGPGRTSALLRARDHMVDAVALRPAHAPYESRRAEFESALDDPGSWTMAP